MLNEQNSLENTSQLLWLILWTVIIVANSLDSNRTVVYINSNLGMNSKVILSYLCFFRNKMVELNTRYVIQLLHSDKTFKICLDYKVTYTNRCNQKFDIIFGQAQSFFSFSLQTFFWL
jgi:hypothetical protein